MADEQGSPQNPASNGTGDGAILSQSVVGADPSTNMSNPAQSTTTSPPAVPIAASTPIEMGSANPLPPAGLHSVDSLHPQSTTTLPQPVPEVHTSVSMPPAPTAPHLAVPAPPSPTTPVHPEPISIPPLSTPRLVPAALESDTTPFLVPHDGMSTPNTSSPVPPVEHTTSPMTFSQPSPSTGRKVGKVIGWTFATVFLLAILSVGGVAAVYRFAPSLFFTYVPSGYALKINTLWPLHGDFSEMVPADTFMYGTLNYGQDSDQAKKLKTLLTRIPGFAEAGNGFTKQANDFLKSEYNVTLSDDIKPAFGDTIYFAATSISQNYPVFSAAVKIKNVAKAQGLMQKIEQSAKSTKLVSRKETYHGVEITVLEQPQIDFPIGTSVLQTYNSLPKLFKTTDLAKTPTYTCKGGLLSACADENALTQTTSGTSTTTRHDGPSVAVMDNFLVISSSIKDMKDLVDFNHAKKPALVTQKSFTQIRPEKSPSLASFYVNIDQLKASLKDSFSDTITKTLYQGFFAWSGAFFAEDSGFQFKSASHFDSKGLNELVAKVMSSPEAPSTFAKQHPGSTAFFAEEGELGSRLKLLASFDSDFSGTGKTKTTIDDTFNTLWGVKLSALGDLITGRYSVSYLPQQKSGFALMTTVNDGAKMAALLEQIKNHITADPARQAQAHTETVGSVPITVYTSTNAADAVYQDYFSPTVAINGTTLIIGTNPSTVKELLQPPTTALSADGQWTLDQKITGTAGRSMVNLNTKRFYNGVVGTVREVTQNPDLAKSDQEKVVDAFLDVFPSISGAQHNQPEVSATIITIPVVALDQARQKQIEDLIKANPNSIFNIAPYLSGIGIDSSSTLPGQSNSKDSRRKSDVQVIARAITTGSSIDNDFSRYKTNGIEKLDPSSGVMKKLIDNQELQAGGLKDPDWPDYYYTLENDGTVAKVTALTESKYSYPDANGCEPKQIRGRWTYCIEQK